MCIKQEPLIFNRVATQPGKPGKVREFDILPKNQGKVREFENFNARSNFHASFKTKLLDIQSYRHIKLSIFNFFFFCH